MDRLFAEISLLDHIPSLFSSEQYMPHGNCYLWQTNLIGLHVISDLLIAIAYFSIPIMLVYFVRKRDDVPFRDVFLLFSLFIITCGTTHLLSIWTLWHADYWLLGIVKACTALVSVFTALTLLPTIPVALAMPSPENLRQINQQLQQQIAEREQAEAELRMSEDRWELAILGSNDGIWDRDLTTNQVFLSPRFKQMIGYQDHELENCRESWLKRIHPDDKEQIVSAAQAHLDGKTDFYMAEYRLRCKDGSYRWFCDRARAKRDPLNQAVRMTGSLRDITARKRAEFDLQQLNQELEARVDERTAAVTKSEQRFRSLFESAPDFIYVLSREGIIQQINSTVIERSGYSKSDMIGKSLSAFLTPAAQQTCYEGFSMLLAEGRHQQEMPFVCKNGKVLIMDCVCTLVENSPMGDLLDEYILVQQRDVTDKKQAEQERIELFATIKASEQRWRSFLEKVRLMVVGIDAKGQVEYVNPYFVEKTGYRQKEVLGRSWIDDFIPYQHQQSCQEILQDLSNQEKPNHYQSNLLTAEGDERTVAWNTTLLQGLKGQPIGTISIGEDVTERAAVDRMKSEFISVVSHELRTPLTAVHGSLDLLASGLVDPLSDKGQHVLSIAVESSNRLVRLVNDILELERLESGKIQLAQAAIPVAEIIKGTYEAVELMAERAGVTIHVEEADLLLWADSDRLTQVLINLVNNAIKFSAPSATVWISAKPFANSPTCETGASGVSEVAPAVAQYVKFTVSDQGRGIPQDKIRSIFERFHQVDATDSRGKGGTGLGLAICRSIIQQHGGDIWVESKLNQGSTFSFTVPRFRQDLSPEGTPQEGLPQEGWPQEILL